MIIKLKLQRNLEMTETKRCYGCLCPHRIGVIVLCFMLCFGIFGIYSEMEGYGPKARSAMIPILCVIATFIGISFFSVVFPGRATASQRYAVFWWWTFMVTIAWNVWWWFLIWNTVWPDGNAGEWECARTLSPGT